MGPGLIAELRSPKSRAEAREPLSQLPGVVASRLPKLASRSPGLSKPLKMGVGTASELGSSLPASAGQSPLSSCPNPVRL